MTEMQRWQGQALWKGPKIPERWSESQLGLLIMTCFLAAQSIINLITPKHPCRAPHTGTTPVDIHEHSACLRSTGLSVCAINCFTTFVLRCVMCVAFFFSVLFWFGFCLIRTAVSPWQCIDKNSLIH